MKVWVISELFYPEESATGYLLTRIAEGIAKSFAVSVLCGQPSYHSRGVKAPTTEDRHGIRIRRCFGTTFDKNNILGRLINLTTLSFSIFLRSLFHLRRGDTVIVVTNPPSLPYFVALACRVKSANLLLLVHDVFPDALVASGVIRRDSILFRSIERISQILYGNSNRIVVLGRDMKALLSQKVIDSQKLMIIPNWGDTEMLSPSPKESNRLVHELGSQDEFVILYAGNMGRTHGLESIVDAAEFLLENRNTSVRFLFIGSGAKKAWLHSEARSRRLTNVTILENRPRNNQQEFLNACDVSIISFVGGMSGVSVPSRMYNIFAVGKPVIAVTDSDSELALTIGERKIGWVVPPGDYLKLAEVIGNAMTSQSMLHQMGKRARGVVTKEYSYQGAIDRYRLVINEISKK